MPNVNPIERLLDALPAAVAKEKRAVIQIELGEAGLWEHYRQNISKPGRLIKISLRAAIVFKRHLGVTDEFFFDTPEVQEEQVKRIVRKHYDRMIPAESH